ncbi:MAG TPA: sensor domain-containing protein, partial [Candidatus Limnocylindrales bacterium]
WYANGAIVLGLFSASVAFAVVIALISAGASVLLAGIGLVLIAFAIEGSRAFASFERRRVFAGEPTRPPAHAYKPLTGGFVAILRAEFLDESRWRDVLYVTVNLPLAVLELVVTVVLWSIALAILTMPVWYDAVPSAGPGPFAIFGGRDLAMVTFRTIVGLALLPVAASVSQLLLRLHRAVVTGLLCTSESRALRAQVETLKESRSAVLGVEASELSRIERDLHDGAQQRLVALTMDLGRASERVEADPEGAKALILEGQAQAREALAEIRQLVRGIAPSILQDRGLVAALESIAGHGPVTTVVTSTLRPGERLPLVVERTAYFVASEALANVAKHSGAGRCEVRIRREPARLVVEVADDGHGGAVVVPASGLAGLRDRLAGVDGLLTVTSPAGGPTVIRAEIPLAA